MKRVISVIQAIVTREDRTRAATLDKPTKHSLTPEEKKSRRRRRPLNTGKTQEGKRRWEGGQRAERAAQNTGKAEKAAGAVAMVAEHLTFPVLPDL